MIKEVNKHAEIAAQTKISPANNSASELLQSANGASGSARNAWLAYLVLNVYLLVTIAGVTHVDLLLNSSVTLPIVNVKIPLFSFFSVAPVLLLLVHLGFLVQHSMLAHKYDHFSKAVSDWESYNKRVHPGRKYVDGYVFSQMIAGPKPPVLLGSLMRLMVFFTFSLLPVLVLLYFQIKFLPYHEVGVTHIHRIAIFLDLLLLLSVRPYITISYLRPLGSKLQIGSKDWPWELSYWSLSVSVVACLTILIFSLFVATVPQGCINPFEEQSESCLSLDNETAKWLPQNVGSDEKQREVFALTALLFEPGKVGETEKTTSPVFARNIVVSDTDLVPDRDDKFEEVSISLRDRDLRFAELDRSDLHRADLTDANLKWSSLIETNLGNAKLKSAKLQGANLLKANLQGANLEEAKLQGANLQWADLQGANLEKTNLQGARLRAAKLQGANLQWADLQGAALFGTNLQGAVLYQAKLQGAILSAAKLQGAVLVGTNLQGASFSSADLRGADLSGSYIWQTHPPQKPFLLHADLTDASFAPLTDEDRVGLRNITKESEEWPWGKRLREALEPLLINAKKANEWDYSRWEAASSDPDEQSKYLAKLVCKDNASGYVAKTIVRGEEYHDITYPYIVYSIIFARSVSMRTCRGYETLDFDTKLYLCESAKWPENEVKNSYCTL